MPPRVNHHAPSRLGVEVSPRSSTPSYHRLLGWSAGLSSGFQKVIWTLALSMSTFGLRVWYSARLAFRRSSVMNSMPDSRAAFVPV